MIAMVSSYVINEIMTFLYRKKLSISCDCEHFLSEVQLGF